MKWLVGWLILTAIILPACRRVLPPVYLQGCSFCSPADSSGEDYPDSLAGYAWKKVCFKDDSFGVDADFVGSTFLDTAVFTDASFSRSVDFSHDTFHRAVYFDDVTFAANTHFDYVRFPHYAKFTNLQSTAGVAIQFADAALPDTMDFSQNPALLCKIDLTTANFDEPDRYDTLTGNYERPHFIFLFNTDISKFKLDYFHFRLLMPDSTITPSLDTKHQRVTRDQKEAMYEALLNNFKQNGQEESYKRLDIEYQKFKWHDSWARWISWVPAIWWNYGYDKEYIFFWILGSLVVFSLINTCWLRTLNTQVYEAVKPEKIADLSKFRRRVWVSVQYTTNIFFRLTLERDCMKFESPGLTVYFFFIYILGVLCLGYLTNFILQQ